jgi:hypothetical protein
VGADSSSWPLPDDPALAAVARALEEHGFAAEIWDADWRLTYLSSEYRILVSRRARDRRLRPVVSGAAARWSACEKVERAKH